MSTIHRLGHSFLAMSLVGGATLAAQSTTGGLRGLVTDESGHPLAQARVVIQSPALFQPRTLVTDARGEYRVMLLPVGEYTLKVSRDGYVGKASSQIRIGAGANLAFNFALKAIRTEQAVVEVVATAAVMEARAADRVSVNYSADQLRQLPGTVSFGSALTLAPGTVDGMRGAGGNQTLLRIDGMDIKEDHTGSAMFSPIQDAIEDIQVVQSASNARNGRAMGGQVNAVSKQGSNTFEGSLRAYYQRPTWTAMIPHQMDWLNAQNQNDSINRYFDVTVSGPILKDRLWFALASRLTPRQDGQTTVAGKGSSSLNYVPGHTWGLLPGVDDLYRRGPRAVDPSSPYGISFLDGGQILPTLAKKDRLDLRLTGALTADHTLSLNYMVDESQSTSGIENSLAKQNISAFIGQKVDKREGLTASLRSTLGSSAFLEVNASKAIMTIQAFAPDSPNPMPVRSHLINDNINNRSTLGFYFLMRSKNAQDPEKRGNHRVDANLKLFVEALGQHEIDFGGEVFRSVFNGGRDTYPMTFASGWYHDDSRGVLDAGSFRFPTIRFMGVDTNRQSDSAPVFGRDARLGPAPTRSIIYLSNGDQINQNRAAYLNDTWSLDAHWNLMAGLRWTQNAMIDTTNVDRTKFQIWEPRFQVKWDPRGDGANVLGFTANRFSSAFNSQTTNYFSSDPWFTNTFHGWTGAALDPRIHGLQPIPGSPNDYLPGSRVPMNGVRFVTYEELIDPRNYDATPFQYRNWSQQKWVKDLQTPFADEMALNYRRNYKRGWINMSLTQRRYKNEWITYNDLGPQAFAQIDDPSGKGKPYLQQATIYENDAAVRTYRTFEVSWQEQLTAAFYWGGSYTYNRQTDQVSDATFKHYASLRSTQLADLSPSDWQGGGKTAEGQTVRLFAVYTQKFGKGEVSWSAQLGYGTSGVSGQSQSARMLPPTELNTWINGGTYNGLNVVGAGSSGLTYTRYLSPNGVWSWGGDSWDIDAKVQWKVPLLRKLQAVGHLAFNGILHRMIRTNQTGHLGNVIGNTAQGFIAGRELRSFEFPAGYQPVGTRGESGNWSDNRRQVTECSVGLKF